MIIQVTKFKSQLALEDVRRVMDERAPGYRAVPGLLQKYYVREPSTGEYGAVYVWESEESVQAFRQTDLAKTIASAYQVTGEPRTEMYELLMPLRAHEAEPASERP